MYSLAFGLAKRSNVDSLHCKLRLLHVSNRRYLYLMMYMYRCARHLPTQPADRVGASTRSNSKRNFPMTRPLTDRFAKSHLYQGQLLWNDLDSDLQRLPDQNWFKRRLKTHLLTTERALYNTS